LLASVKKLMYFSIKSKKVTLRESIVEYQIKGIVTWLGLKTEKMEEENWCQD